LQEKERNRGAQKKSLTSLQQLEEEGFSQQSGADVHKLKTIQLFLLTFWLPPQLTVPVRAGMWLTPKQLEKYQDVLKKLLAEMSQDTPDG
ncbi:MOTI protein, partial [Piaya cayana]|nr:MOTI protein [Piaya cayana]